MLINTCQQKNSQNPIDNNTHTQKYPYKQTYTHKQTHTNESQQLPYHQDCISATQAQPGLNIAPLEYMYT